MKGICLALYKNWQYKIKHKVIYWFKILELVSLYIRRFFFSKPVASQCKTFQTRNTYLSLDAPSECTSIWNNKTPLFYHVTINHGGSSLLPGTQYITAWSQYNQASADVNNHLTVQFLSVSAYPGLRVIGPLQPIPAIFRRRPGMSCLFMAEPKQSEKEPHLHLQTI